MNEDGFRSRDVYLQFARPTGSTRARWDLCGYSNSHYPVTVEGDLPAERALAIARLLGCEDEALAAMRAEVRGLRERSARRLERSREARAEQEEYAVAERREADRLSREVARLEVAVDD